MKENWTGERLETFIKDQTSIEHLHRYAVALDLVKDKIVLDIASGEGYGTHLLSFRAKIIKGVDIDVSSIKKAKLKYKRNNLEFKAGSTSSIPYNDCYFDIVVSFETIEHHNEHEKMMEEIKRVLKPNGILIISSPDRLNYSEKRNFINKFHVKELYKEQFKSLINNHYQNANFYLQKSTFASILIPECSPNGFIEYSGDYNSIINNTDFYQHYIVAIASDAPINNLKLSIFIDNEIINRSNLEIITTYNKSWSYRIGKLILLPIQLLSTYAKKLRIYK